MHHGLEEFEEIRQDEDRNLWQPDKVNALLEEEEEHVKPQSSTRRGFGKAAVAAATPLAAGYASGQGSLQKYSESSVSELNENMMSKDGEHVQFSAEKKRHIPRMELTLKNSLNFFNTTDAYTVVEFEGEEGDTIYGVAEGAYTPSSAGNLSSSKFTNKDSEYDPGIHIEGRGEYEVLTVVDEIEDVMDDRDPDIGLDVGDYVVKIDEMSPVDL